VRAWRYPRAAVVLGRSQRADDALVARARGAGLEVRERASGGGAVLVGPWMFGASLVLPPGHRLVGRDIAASYFWLGEVFAAWLRTAGIDAQLVTRPVDAGVLKWSCFAGLSHGEVVVDGRKLLGLAQARRRGGTLFEAGLLLDATPWELLCEVLAQPPEAARELAARATSCAALLGAPPPEDALRDLAARLEAAVAGA
jgi:lipoate-protein ligase A